MIRLPLGKTFALKVFAPKVRAANEPPTFLECLTDLWCLASGRKCFAPVARCDVTCNRILPLRSLSRAPLLDRPGCNESSRLSAVTKKLIAALSSRGLALSLAKSVSNLPSRSPADRRLKIPSMFALPFACRLTMIRPTCLPRWP